MTKISDIGSVRSLVALAMKKDITDVVLSPGSRNAPFILSFTALDAFSCTSVLDERVAGFIALGIAQQRQKPVIVNCTSGSASVNLMPAMTEAFYQRIPLIAVTADRPAEWIGQGEGQSINQHGLMRNLVWKSFNLVNEHTADDAWYNQRLINEAFESAINYSMPVHINVPLAEPLYGLKALDGLEVRNTKHIYAKHSLTEVDLDALKTEFSRARRVLILATQGTNSGECAGLLADLNKDPRVAVLTETPANLYQLDFVSCIDRTLQVVLGKEDEVDYIPDLLITLGGNVISKKVKAFLRKHKQNISAHWHVGYEPLDTFQCLTMWINAQQSYVLSALINSTTSDVSARFGIRWKSAFFMAEERHHQFLENCEYSDLKVFAHILDFIPDGSILQMGNSSVVRYIQLFNQIQHIRYFGNRGVSGIEGCTSTAVGAAMATNELTVLVSGDHAFRYDSNALAGAGHLSNLCVIVINNGGGNIFRIIEGPVKHAANEPYIEKVDDGSVRKLVDYHNCTYMDAHDFKSLESALSELFSLSRNNCTVLEVFTPRLKNPEILKQYFSNLA